MGIVHHAVSPIWMELFRSDLLRDLGHSYAEWEKHGVMMSVVELQLISRVLCPLEGGTSLFCQK
jgi:acyl-CoA thioester hydrolase